MMIYEKSQQGNSNGSILEALIRLWSKIGTIYVFLHAD